MILNADVTLKEEFFEKVMIQFSKGYDIILSKSIVINNNTNFSSFLELLIEYDFIYKLKTIYWTEAFICRKNIFEDKSNYFFNKNKNLKLHLVKMLYFLKTLLIKDINIY